MLTEFNLELFYREYASIYLIMIYPRNDTEIGRWRNQNTVLCQCGHLWKPCPFAICFQKSQESLVVFIDVCGDSGIRLSRGLDVLFHQAQKQGDKVGSHMTSRQYIQKIAGYYLSLPCGLQLPALFITGGACQKSEPKGHTRLHRTPGLGSAIPLAEKLPSRMTFRLRFAEM